MWLRPIELMSFDGVLLKLRAPNSYVRLWFESNFLGTLLKEIQDLGHDVRVEFAPDGPDERLLAPPAGPATGSSPELELAPAAPAAPGAPPRPESSARRLRCTRRWDRDCLNQPTCRA
jgi:hypothetical protein